MANNPDSGNFKINSRTKGPIGIGYTSHSAQNVLVGRPLNEWVLKKAGGNKYRLSIGGYPSTAVDHEQVVVSTKSKEVVEWEITLREYQQAYTIAPVSTPDQAWTVVGDGREIWIKPITTTNSNPPIFSPNQLFKFEEAFDLCESVCAM